MSFLEKARQKWQEIAKQTQKRSIKKEMVTEAGQATVDAIESAMPYIGENGNWVIDGKDTGHSSSGDLTSRASIVGVDFDRNKHEFGLIDK